MRASCLGTVAGRTRMEIKLEPTTVVLKGKNMSATPKFDSCWSYNRQYGPGN
jgi:hypothetical protein